MGQRMSPPQPEPVPQPVPPELFIDVSGSLVPSEAASYDETTFVHSAIDAIRANLPERKQTLQDRMDELRRARVAQERQDYLDLEPTEANQSVSVGSAVTSMALQGQFELGIDPTSESSLTQPKRVAFGRYLKKAVHDVVGEMNPTLISEKERTTMFPDNIAPTIFRDSKRRSEQEGYYVDDVLLNQVEYRMLPRSPRHLATSTHARTLGQLDVREDGDVLARADRSIGHVFERLKPVLRDHLGSLVSAYTDLDKLSKLVKNTGFAHVGPAEMERLISVAWSEFNNLIHVVAVQRKWDPEQIQVAGISLVSSFTEGAQNKRVKAFSDELKFAKRYLRSRVRLYENRLGITDSYLPEADEDTDSKTA